MTRFFIGPLTANQQERRRKARERYQEIAEIQYARYITFREALKVHARQNRWFRTELSEAWG